MRQAKMSYLHNKNDNMTRTICGRWRNTVKDHYDYDRYHRSGFKKNEEDDRKQTASIAAVRRRPARRVFFR